MKVSDGIGGNKIMQIAKLIIIVFGITVFGGISYLGLLRADKLISEYNRYLDNEAIHECAMDYRQETTDRVTGEVHDRPMEQQVRECAYQKGVTNYKGVWSDLVEPAKK